MSKLLVVRRSLLDPHEPGLWIIAFLTVALLWLTFHGLFVDHEEYLSWDDVLLPCLVAAALVTIVHWRLGVVMVLASPYVVTPIVNAAMAPLDYAHGTAVLRRDTEGHDLDGELRLHGHPHTCFGTEPLSDDVYDLVLTALVRNLGPMPGAYTGPYPSFREAHEWLDEHGHEVSLSEAQLGRVVVDGRAFDISEYSSTMTDAQRPLTAALMDDQLLMLRWMDTADGWTHLDPKRVLLMVDARTDVLRRRRRVAWYTDRPEPPPSTTPSE